jgi:hypothetical protein
MNYALLSLTVVIVMMSSVPLTQSTLAQKDDSNDTEQKVLNFTQGAVKVLKDAGEKVESYIHNMTSDSNQTTKNMTSEIDSNSSNIDNATVPSNETTIP